MRRTAGPVLSHPVEVRVLPAAGLAVTVEADEAAREALAAELGLAGIARLVGSFRVLGTPSRVHVTGRVEAEVTQVCVVSLDPFDTAFADDVEVDFAEPADPERPARALPKPAELAEDAPDPPDEIVDGRIDLGTLTAEFLALGLDPYPRKPGAALPEEASVGSPDSPFAVLGKLRG